MKLGLQEVLFYEPKLPAFCQDEHRKFVWAPLDPEAAIAPAENAIRIVSSEAADSVSTPISRTRRRTKPVSQPTEPQTAEAKTDGRHKSNGQATSIGEGHKVRRKADHQGISALIEQAEKLRTARARTS